jgi:hypothetical protein
MPEPDLSPSELRRLQQRYRHLQAEVAQLGWIAQGSLLPNPPRSWPLTRKVRGKTVTPKHRTKIW